MWWPRTQPGGQRPVRADARAASGAHYGAEPTHAAFDCGYATKQNLNTGKALGVRHAVFQKIERHQARGHDAVVLGSRAVQALPRRNRAGTSYLKRCFGLGCCNWRGLARFRANVHFRRRHPQPIRMARLGLAEPRQRASV